GEAAVEAGKLKVDYMGILMVATAFDCLEVVLDRDERLDWFESNFIVGFFVVAIASMVFALVWELRHPDPVVEISLLKDRNFAIANAFYFLFGFVLYGSALVIPPELPSL